jgi:hypothetical protein
MLSADSIVYAVNKGADRVLLQKRTGCENVWNFNNFSDLRHCLDILSNQIRLVELGMADTRRMYDLISLKGAFEKLSKRYLK